MSDYMAKISQLIYSGDIKDLSAFSSGGTWMFLLVAALFAITLSAMTGAIMSRYGEGLLSKETTLKDLSDKILSNMGKLVLIGLVMGLIVMFATILIVMLIILLGAVSNVLMVLGFTLLFVAVFAIIPPLYLIRFPALFQGESTMGSIKKGWRLGFKSWGTTFLTIIIVGIVSAVISAILAIPYSIWIATHLGQSGVVSYTLSGISSLGTAFVAPLVFVFFAFQYFAVVENVEGTSLQEKVEEFDNL